MVLLTRLLCRVPRAAPMDSTPSSLLAPSRLVEVPLGAPFTHPCLIRRCCLPLSCRLQAADSTARPTGFCSVADVPVDRFEGLAHRTRLCALLAHVSVAFLCCTEFRSGDAIDPFQRGVVDAQILADDV